MQQLRSNFANIDFDGDGKISKWEFRSGCQKIFGFQPSIKDVNVVFQALDTDNNGWISIGEFVENVDVIHDLYEKKF